MFLASLAGFSYLYRNSHIGRALLLEASSVSMTTDSCYDEPRLLVDALYTNSNIHLPIIHVPNDGVRHSFTLACWLMFALCLLPH